MQRPVGVYICTLFTFFFEDQKEVPVEETAQLAFGIFRNSTSLTKSSLLVSSAFSHF